MTYPENFLTRTIDRSLLIKLKQRNGISNPEGSFYLYRIWADFAQGVSKNTIDKRYLPEWTDEDYTTFNGRGVSNDAATLRSCELFSIVEMFVGWEGEENGLINAALDAGFLLLKRDDVRGIYLECVGFNELNTPKKKMQARGGMTKGINTRRRKAVQKSLELEDYLEAQDKASELQDDLSAEDAKHARSLILQINRVLDNAGELGVGDWTPDLVTVGHELMQKCKDEAGVAKLLEWCYLNKGELVGKERMDLVLPQLLELNLETYHA